jgi:hypothetical protein
MVAVPAGIKEVADMAFPDRQFFRSANVGNWQSATDALETGFAFGYFGGFFSSAQQTLAAINTPQAITLNNSFGSYGVSVVDNTKITFANPGDYTLTYVASVSSLSESSQDSFFWIKFNGSDYANSTTEVTTPARKSAGVPSSQLLTITFVGTAPAAGNFVELYWYSTSTDISLRSRVAGTSPVIPASPSIMVSVAQVGAVR